MYTIAICGFLQGSAWACLLQPAHNAGTSLQGHSCPSGLILQHDRQFIVRDLWKESRAPNSSQHDVQAEAHIYPRLTCRPCLWYAGDADKHRQCSTIAATARCSPGGAKELPWSGSAALPGQRSILDAQLRPAPAPPPYAGLSWNLSSEQVQAYTCAVLVTVCMSSILM